MTDHKSTSNTNLDPIRLTKPMRAAIDRAIEAYNAFKVDMNCSPLMTFPGDGHLVRTLRALESRGLVESNVRRYDDNRERYAEIWFPTDRAYELRNANPPTEKE